VEPPPLGGWGVGGKTTIQKAGKSNNNHYNKKLQPLTSRLKIKKDASIKI